MGWPSFAPPIMLLRFTAPDMLNTSLIDVATGDCVYDIVTVLSGNEEDKEPVKVTLPTSGSSAQTACETQSFKSPSPTMASSSLKQPHLEEPDDPMRVQKRKSTVTGACGTVVAEILWNGRHPTITICDDKVGALTDLFGSTSVPFQPKILIIPTRFDTEYIWTATADSLTLYDYDTDSVEGTFHQNVLRIPTKSKVSKFKSSPSSLKVPISPISSSPSLENPKSERKNWQSTFIPAHVPGLGSNYLEFTSHPLAHDIEIIISFLMMEILRRGRFNMTPYTFDKPKLWHFKEAKNFLLRRLRRHTL